MPEKLSKTSLVVRSEVAKREPPYISLPHRPVYDKNSAFARMRALFRHAADECVEFLQHDRRVIAIGAATVMLSLWNAALWSGWRLTWAEITPDLKSLVTPVLIAVGVYVWCFAKAPFQLRLRRLRRDLDAALLAHEQMTTELQTRQSAFTEAVRGWTQKENSLEAELVALRQHRPKIVVTFNLEPDEQGKCFHIRNHGDRGASNIHVLINVPDTSYSLSVSIEQLAAGEPINKAPKLSWSRGQWSPDHAKTEGLIIFLRTARMSAHSARSRAEHERIRAARETGDDATEHDTQTVIDGMFADILADKDIQGGSDETVLFDVSYQNVEGTWEYRAPHVLTITPKGEVRISRIGVEAERIPISPVVSGGGS